MKSLFEQNMNMEQPEWEQPDMFNRHFGQFEERIEIINWYAKPDDPNELSSEEYEKIYKIKTADDPEKIKNLVLNCNYRWTDTDEGGTTFIYIELYLDDLDERSPVTIRIYDTQIYADELNNKIPMYGNTRRMFKDLFDKEIPKFIKYETLGTGDLIDFIVHVKKQVNMPSEMLYDIFTSINRYTGNITGNAIL